MLQNLCVQSAIEHGFVDIIDSSLVWDALRKTSKDHIVGRHPPLDAFNSAAEEAYLPLLYPVLLHQLLNVVLHLVVVLFLNVYLVPDVIHSVVKVPNESCRADAAPFPFGTLFILFSFCCPFFRVDGRVTWRFG